MTEGKNLSLHGFRGLASILVVFYHIYGMAYIGGFFEKREVEGMFILVNNLGSMSVNLFFMISGYLIIGSLIRQRNVKSFMINRIIRIYPVFFVLHVVIFLFGPIINYEWLGEATPVQYFIGFFTNLFLMPGIFDLPIAQSNAWSLSYEFVFYIISALFFLVILNASTKKSIKLILICFLCLLSATIIYFHHTAVFFVLGVIVYYGSNKIKNIYSYHKAFYLNGAALLPLVFFSYDPENVFGTITLILSLFLFWEITNEKGLLSTILKTKPLQFLGTISYSLYLIHPFVLFPLKIIFSMQIVQTFIANEYSRITIFGLASLIGAIVASYISFVLLEDKLVARIKKLIKDKNIKTSETKKRIVS